MEKGTIILSIGFIIIVGLYSLNMARVDINTDENSLSYTNGRQARQIALSGVALATNNLRYNPSWMAGYSGRALMDGTLDLSIDSTGLQLGQRRIIAVGHYSGTNHTAQAIIQIAQPASNFDLNLLHYQSAIEMRGDSFSVFYGNKFYVDAYDSSGLLNPGYGFGTSSVRLDSSATHAVRNASIPDAVVGLGTRPSVTPLASTVDRITQANAVLSVATIVYRSGTLGRGTSWGTVNSPHIVYVNRDFTVNRTLTGAGILCINGDLTVKNSLNWDGYVIVVGRNLKVQSGATMTVNGTVYYGTNTGATLRFGSNGNMRVIYNTAILTNLNQKMFTITLGKPSMVKLFD